MTSYVVVVKSLLFQFPFIIGVRAITRFFIITPKDTSFFDRSFAKSIEENIIFYCNFDKVARVQ